MFNKLSQWWALVVAWWLSWPLDTAWFFIKNNHVRGFDFREFNRVRKTAHLWLPVGTRVKMRGTIYLLGTHGLVLAEKGEYGTVVWCNENMWPTIQFDRGGTHILTTLEIVPLRYIV
jgi:hypothetical protein